MNKALKLVFVASMILNVLFVGVFAGQLPHRFDRGTSRHQRMENFIEALPESVQARFRETMKDGDPLRSQIRAARNEAIRALAAEPFDESAYDRQVQKINELRVQRTNKMAADVKDIAKDLPLEQRKALAEALKRPSRPAS
jgi:uncharacterized membrane protein